MLVVLQFKESNLEGIERKIAMKMSKSKPETAIFMTDTRKDILRKFKGAYCPEKEEKDNPVLEYAKYIVFEMFDKIEVKRDNKFGGDITLTGYDDLRDKYLNGKIHPLDLKATIAEYIDRLISPVRKHFEKGKPRELAEKVKKFQVTI